MTDALAPDLPPSAVPAIPEGQTPSPVAAKPIAAAKRARFTPMARFEPPFSILGEGRSPFVVASPHSGRVYPKGFLAASRLDPITLRQSEDAFVDRLVEDAPAHGAPLIHAHFPRAFLDANREAWELDPTMFSEPLPAWCNTRSIKVVGGLGTIARIVSDGINIYGKRLDFAEAEYRIKSLYQPYHGALKGLLDTAFADHGCSVLVDCHSMPSVGGPGDRDRGANRCDFIVGDRYGTSCSPILSRLAVETLRAMGYRVGRNAPYAGGFCTAHYGDPSKGRHAVQIEVNRALYMDEAALTPLPSFPQVARDMGRLLSRLTTLRTEFLRPS